MSSERPYPHAPVVEALCEVHFAQSTWRGSIVGDFHDRVRAEFPRLSEHENQEPRVGFGDSYVAEAGVRSIGTRMRYESPELHRIIQVGPGLVVVNQLQPYPRFEEWEPTIRRAAAIYDELVQPTGIERIGLRYINHIVLPGESVRLQDYFTIHPQPPPSWQDSHGSFLLRLERPLGDGKSLLLTFGTAPSPAAKSAYLLDLYAVQEGERLMSLQQLPIVTAELHTHIEQAFESSITDLLRKRFAHGDE